MLRRADGWRSLLWAANAARIGGACLGLGIVVSSPAPEVVLPLLALALLLVGGSAWSVTSTSTVAVRLAGPFVMVIAVRIAGGTVAAAIAALLVALGAWLQVRLTEASVGLAIFAGAVAVLGGARVPVLVAFWLLGAAILLARATVATVRRRLAGRSSLKPERTPVVPLGPEN